MVEMKVCFESDSEKELKSFPRKVLEKFAQDLALMKQRMAPLSTVKPMKGLGKGICELKKNGRPAYRLVYVIRDDVIHVLYAFSKTSKGTDKKHEVTISARFKNL